LPMVTALAAVVLAAVYLALARYLIVRGVNASRAAVAVMAAVVLGATHWAARPHLFSQLGFALLLPLLSGRRGRWWHWALLFGVWANLHPGFVLGLALAGAAAAGWVVDGYLRGRGPNRHRRAMRIGLGAAVGALATLANPWGVATHVEILRVLND